jgi:5-(carboxyamino)imidazole ribonucleotide mutase
MGNFKKIMSDKSEKIPLISIIAGSTSDKEVYEKAERVLNENGINYDLQIISAHRNPKELDEYIKSSHSLVYIAVAGLSAALPGVIASKTDKVVIGVPVSANLGGIDALLSIVQMPPGVPVACVGIDRGDNAAYLAIRLLKLLK